MTSASPVLMKALGSSRHRRDIAGFAQVAGEATPSLTRSGRTEYERRLDLAVHASSGAGASASGRLQLILDIADTAEVRITAPHRPPAASPGTAPSERSRRGSHRASGRINSDSQVRLVICASASGERRRRLTPKLSNLSRIATVPRTTKSLHQHGRCRSHLTRRR